MASPQKENGYVPIANEIFEALCRTRIPGEARQVLDVIIRKTYGWGKREDMISLSQFVEATGIKTPNVCRGLNLLYSMNLIIKKDNGVIEKDNAKGATYSFQKDFEKWKPLSKKITLSKKIIKPLSKKIDTKDTNTKDSIIVPFQKIVETYHELLPQLPRVVKLTDKRKSQIKARWLESEKTQSLDWWRGFFEMVRTIPFLMGQNDRGWKADLEFLTRQEPFIKVLEGKYG